MVAIKVTSCTWGWAMSAEVACGDDVYSEALWWTMTGLRISSPLQPPLLWHESLNQLSPVTTDTQACARFKVETVCSQTFVSNIGRIREVEHVFYTTMDHAMCVIVVLAPFHVVLRKDFNWTRFGFGRSCETSAQPAWKRGWAWLGQTPKQVHIGEPLGSTRCSKTCDGKRNRRRSVWLGVAKSAGGKTPNAVTRRPDHLCDWISNKSLMCLWSVHICT